MAEMNEQKLNDWLIKNDQWVLSNETGKQAIKASYQFDNFKQAIGFIIALAGEMEDMNHHAEVYNIYNRVDLTLTTHDAGNKVTEKDIALASKAQEIVFGVTGVQEVGG